MDNTGGGDDIDERDFVLPLYVATPLTVALVIKCRYRR
jgi:hypothetical protein